MKTSRRNRSVFPFLLGLGLVGMMATWIAVFFFPSPQATSKATPAATPYQMKLSDPLPANLFVELGKKIKPSIANISVLMGGNRGRGGPGPRDPFWDFFEEFMGPRGFQQIPQRPQAQSIGTGFVIDASGLILTNNHVIADADEIRVQFAGSEKSYTAEVVGADPRTDVGLLKIKTDVPLHVAELGDSDKTEEGEWVAAFGNPYGHTFSMSKGIVSAKSRLIRDLNSVPFIQTDASINPGNSGGPLVNTKGEVIAINSAIDARAQGVGFSIPINHVKAILPQLKSKGRVIYGWLGVEMAPITPQARQYLGLKNEQGVLIAGVALDSPADKAGLQATDVVVEFNKKKIENIEAFRDAVMESAVGSKAPLVVVREGRKQNLNVTIGENPGDSRVRLRQVESKKSLGTEAPFQLGFQVADYTEALAQRFRIVGRLKGPVVIDVRPNSPAARSGLKSGDMILSVRSGNRKDTPVRTKSDLIKNLSKGGIVLQISSGGRTSLVFLDTSDTGSNEEEE